MLAMKDLRLTVGTLLAADTNFLAAASANKVGLFINNLTPNENMVIGDVTAATFTGYAAIAAGTGTQNTGVDPLTGDQMVTIKEPAGGWRFVTTGTTNLPQTVYGYYLMDNAGTVLLAVGLLPTPITLQATGEEINLGTVKFTVVSEPLS